MDFESTDMDIPSYILCTVLHVSTFKSSNIPDLPKNNYRNMVLLGNALCLRADSPPQTLLYQRVGLFWFVFTHTRTQETCKEHNKSSANLAGCLTSST